MHRHHLPLGGGPQPVFQFRIALRNKVAAHPVDGPPLAGYGTMARVALPVAGEHAEGGIGMVQLHGT